MSKSSKKVSTPNSRTSPVVLHSSPVTNSLETIKKISESQAAPVQTRAPISARPSVTESKQSLSTQVPASVVESIVRANTTTTNSDVKKERPSYEDSQFAVASSASKKQITALKVPSWIEPRTIVTTVNEEGLDSHDREVSTTSQNTKKYTTYTGMSEDEPVIIATSEFVPLFEGSKRTLQGGAISLKQNARIVTAKTAITTLLQEEDTKKIVENNKRQLSSFIEKESRLLDQLLSILKKTYGALDISSYVVSRRDEQVNSLYEILRRGGYSSNNITNFTQTKLWQQALLELKRVLLSHSTELGSQSFIRNNVKNDSDPFLLSDVDGPPIGLKRIWVNPYYVALPTTVDLADKSKISDNISWFIDFGKNQYVDLSQGNPPERVIRSNDFTLDKSITLKTNNSTKFAKQPIVLSDNVLKEYESSGKDISILANALIKEATYSNYLLNSQNSAHLLSKFGYTVSNSGDNFQVWDHVVGRFPESVLNSVNNPTGLGNSLVSISQSNIRSGEDEYQVLTFERNYHENSNVTPGTHYYIDSSLTSIDGTTFSTLNLDQLIKKVESGYSTTKTIFDLMGYEIKSQIVDVDQSLGELYIQKDATVSLSLSGIMEKLSVVTSNVYQKNFRRVLDRIVSLDRSPNDSATSDSIRFAALVCKCATSPTSPYVNSSSRLKSLLFLLLMNVVMQQSNGVSNDGTIQEVTRLIAKQLIDIKAEVNQDEIERARQDKRTHVYSTTSFVSGRIGSQKSPNSNLISTNVRTSRLFEETVTDGSNIDTTSSLIGSAARSFNTNSGLFKIMIDLMKEVYDNPGIYRNDVTGYSGTSRIAYIYSYYDLILRIVAAQTPENLIGSYEFSSGQGPQGNKSFLVERGFYIDKVDEEQIKDYFDPRFSSIIYDSKKSVKRLTDALNFLKIEEEASTSSVALIRKYLSDLLTVLTSFKTFLTNNFKEMLSEYSRVYANDDQLDDNQKRALLNLSLSEEQLKLSKYMMSELRDRINDGDSSAKLKSTPWFKTFPDGFENFLDVEGIDLISYSMLSPYFNSEQFFVKLGGNKKIISIGLPIKMASKLYTSTRLSLDRRQGMRQGIVRLKVYKLDRLHPDVVYQPKTFLFEMNRFPTRSLTNWSYGSFADNNTNILSIPSKVIIPSGDIFTHKDFADAFPSALYGSYLSDSEKFEIYSNHSISFLTEEYLRWFTDCKFSESRYCRYVPMDQVLTQVEDQYRKYVSIAGSKAASPLARRSNTNAPTSTGILNASYLDPVSGKTFLVPVQNPIKSQTGQANGPNMTQVSPQGRRAAAGGNALTIPMDDTVRSYFKSETFFSDPMGFLKRIVYPKKFDRVFNVIIDPDEFYVDMRMTSQSAVDALVQNNVLVGKSQNYRQRDLGPGDVSLDEYFVSIEPYDYSEK